MVKENFKPIRQARFDVLTFSRTPYAKFFAEEVEWYADEQENVIATLTRDTTDNDWGYVVLGRDQRGLFRAIENDVSYATIEKARNTLIEKITEYSYTRQEVFPQGEAKRKKNAIFKQLVPKDRLHPYLRVLMDEEAYSPAREIIREIAYAFEDPDGNYIEQFQSTGFNARLWELYLYAFLHEEGFTIHRNFSAPDYICEKFGHNVCIEAVTVNPTGGTEPDEPPSSPEEVQERSRDYMPIKFGSALFSKLRRRYWEKKHVAGHPLIFAIEDFHQPGSLLWSRIALVTYLYGYRHTWGKDKNGKRTITPEKIETHQYGDKKIPSGFFFLPEAENVSAVLFSNSATISKFNRMGKLAEFGSPRVRMIREGTCHNHDPNAAEPLRFVVEVNPSSYDELWGEGLSMYHNPRAAIPVDPALFPNIAHHWFEDGQIAGDLPEFFPYGSVTHIWIEQEP